MIEFNCPFCNKKLRSANKCRNCKQEFVCLRDGISGFKIQPKDINEEFLGKYRYSTGMFVTASSNYITCSSGITLTGIGTRNIVNANKII